MVIVNCSYSNVKAKNTPFLKEVLLALSLLKKTYVREGCDVADFVFGPF